MVNVAIAGGTSPTLGKAITEAILATGKHKIIILTRSDSEVSDESKGDVDTTIKIVHGASVVPVDYNSTTSLTNLFKSRSINHLISVLKIPDEKLFLKIHQNMLDAAHDAKLDRCILSDWSLAPNSNDYVDLLKSKKTLFGMAKSYVDKALKTRDGGNRRTERSLHHIVECITIQNGGFLEYFVQGCPDPSLQAGLDDDLMLSYIDIKNGKLLIPCKSGPGNEQTKSSTPASTPTPAYISMSSLRDIGTLTASSLDIPVPQLSNNKYIAQVPMWSDVFTYDIVHKIMASLSTPNSKSPTSSQQPPTKKVKISESTSEPTAPASNPRNANVDATVNAGPLPELSAKPITRAECLSLADQHGNNLATKLKDKGEFDVGLLKEQMVAQMYACLCGEVEFGGLVDGAMAISMVKSTSSENTTATATATASFSTGGGNDGDGDGDGDSRNEEQRIKSLNEWFPEVAKQTMKIGELLEKAWGGNSGTTAD